MTRSTLVCVVVLLGSAVYAAEPSVIPPVSPTGEIAPPVVSVAPVEFASPADDTAASGMLAGNHQFPGFIGFISNPLQNIDPRALTAIYPIFGSAWTSQAGPVPSADFQLYGPAVTVALSDRFAVGLNQGGYADIHLSTKDGRLRQRLARIDPTGRFASLEAGGNRSGFLNLGGFAQYTIWEDVASQSLVTAGMRLAVPCGSHDILQGRGPALLAPYLTAGKEFAGFHVLATTGFQFPAGRGNDASDLFYADIHVDRQLFGWLYPLVEFNSVYHTSNTSIDLPGRLGFFDFGDFETSGNIVTMAVGVNAVLKPEKYEIGMAYFTSIAADRDFSVNGLMVKAVIRY